VIEQLVDVTADTATTETAELEPLWRHAREKRLSPGNYLFDDDVDSDCGGDDNDDDGTAGRRQIARATK
jgi:hypothetical protein